MSRFTASDFEYPLDPSLIAQEPLGKRDDSRLMLLNRAGGGRGHHVFSQLPSLLREGDLLVLNDTAVIPALFRCRRATGGKIDGLFLQEIEPGIWEVMLNNAGRCKAGESLGLELEPGVRLELAANLGMGRWRVRVEPSRPAMDVLRRAGSTPLPPYIHRPAGAGAKDSRRYQTVYAQRPGAVAAPTAGLHFTPELMARLQDNGISSALVTLHVGLGTFAPVKSEDLTRHPMHSEWYDLPAATCAALNAARRQGRRIVAVGTTSLRVLETAASADGEFAPCSGWTDVFLYPPAAFRAAGALITNFHLPRSTLLMLVAAFCDPGGLRGLDMIKAAYAEAAAMRYRFYSYGDAMLIE